MDWCPTGFKVGINYQPPTSLPGGDQAKVIKDLVVEFQKLYFEFQASLYKICTKNRVVLDPAITHDPKMALTTGFDKRQLDCLIPVGSIKVSLATLKHSC